MKKTHKILLLLFLLFLSLEISAQAVGTPYMPLDKVLFSFLYGGSGADAGRVVQQTPDGGYIIGGISASSISGDVGATTHGGADYWIAKLNRYGRIEWQKLYGGNSDESVSAGGESTLHRTSDGGYIVACSTTSSASGDISGTNHGFRDTWVFKIDAAGVLQWQRLYGGSGDDDVQAIIETADGGYLMLVETTSSASGDVTGTNHSANSDAWIVKLNATGNISWQKLYGGTSNDVLRAVKQNSDGTYILAGSAFTATGDITGTAHGDADFWVMKLNASGNIIWQSLYGGSEQDDAYSIDQTSDGGYIIVGNSRSPVGSGDVTGPGHGNNQYDYWLVKINGSGTLQWQRLYGGNGEEFPYSVHQTADGNYILGGLSTSSASGDITETNKGGYYDIWILKVNTSGNILWQKLFGTFSSEGFRSIVQTSDNGYAVIGTSSGNSVDVSDARKGYSEYWFFRLDDSGKIIWIPDERQKN